MATNACHLNNYIPVVFRLYQKFSECVCQYLRHQYEVKLSKTIFKGWHYYIIYLISKVTCSLVSSNNCVFRLKAGLASKYDISYRF